MQFEAVLFDLDYTLFDSEASEREALDKTLLASGIEPNEITLEMYRTINHALWKSLEREEIELERLRVKRFEDLAAQLQLVADPLTLADDYTTNLGLCGLFYPEAEPTLQQVGEKVKVGLITNGVSETQRSRLVLHDFEKYFDAIVVSGEFGIAKPNQAIFQEALRLLALKPEDRVLMVGDSLSSDMAGANLSGLSTCWYNPKNTDCPKNIKIDYVIHSLDEVLEILCPE
ncbi:MAG: YjjG family noncanonical pyrimidine nucleotidase [Acidimicrobiales bacterium]|nr:YjjG family noncanonical pyrimidine nucleotidase [Acidimicrobiales bacterium]